MPSYADAKAMLPNSYYHVYTHAVGRELCFRDELDRLAFIEALRVRVVPGLAAARGSGARTFESDLSVLSNALMGNHLHFVLHQGEDAAAISDFMHALRGGYARNFNLRHNRQG